MQTLFNSLFSDTIPTQLIILDFPLSHLFYLSHFQLFHHVLTHLLSLHFFLYQAPGDDSEVVIRPVQTYPDPFRPGSGNLLVLCETYTPDGKPLPSNTRNAAAAVFADKHNTEQIPWFGLEQVCTEWFTYSFDKTSWAKSFFWLLLHRLLTHSLLSKFNILFFQHLFQHFSHRLSVTLLFPHT